MTHRDDFPPHVGRFKSAETGSPDPGNLRNPDRAARPNLSCLTLRAGRRLWVRKTRLEFKTGARLPASKVAQLGHIICLKNYRIFAENATTRQAAEF